MDPKPPLPETNGGAIDMLAQMLCNAMDERTPIAFIQWRGLSGQDRDFYRNVIRDLLAYRSMIAVAFREIENGA